MKSDSTSNKKLGLWTTTALVVGGMIGSGIFSLPVSLAQYGGISLFGWMFAAIGAFILAKILGFLSKVIPATGGPYAYSRKGFGDFVGFFVAWGYWLSIWATNAAITITFVSYLGVFIPALRESTSLSLLTGLITIWSLTALNSYSVKAGGKAQLITTILKIIPLVVVTIGGLFFIQFAHFKPLNISEVSSFKAITICTALCLFAFMGLEAATIPAGNIESPEKTIPKATMLGTIFVTIIYMISSFSLFGVLSPAEIVGTASPFAAAASKMWGANAEYLVAAGACISTLGALNGWILIQGQVPMAMAQDGLFPKPFARTNKNESPYFSIIASSIVITVLLLLNQSKGLADIYTYMVLLTTVTVLVAYIFSIASYGLFAAENKFGLSPTITNILLVTFGFGFSIWMMIGSGHEAVFIGFIGLLLGIPIYIWNKRKT
jgi:basic amino acid/polyamine antiporter, APA family